MDVEVGDGHSLVDHLIGAGNDARRHFDPEHVRPVFHRLKTSNLLGTCALKPC